jgi:hypothetical protein
MSYGEPVQELDKYFVDHGLDDSSLALAVHRLSELNDRTLAAARVLESLYFDPTYPKLLEGLDALSIDPERHAIARTLFLETGGECGLVFSELGRVPSEVKDFLRAWQKSMRDEAVRVRVALKDARHFLFTRQAALLPSREALKSMGRVDLNALLTQEWAKYRIRKFGLEHNPALPVKDLRGLAECLRGDL